MKIATINMRKLSYWIIHILVIAVVTGCAPAIKRNPVPEALVDVAGIKNLEDVRFWGDVAPPNMEAWLKEARWDEMESKSHHYLALSGGGEDGAYGAGFLNGWTAMGTRPEFTYVTGISTGAILAPFAFLGPDYDDEIKEFYTEFDTADLIKPWPLSKIFSKAALYDNLLLRSTIKKYITQEVMEKIAAEYKKGRILDIGTTNLDTERPVIWSIGRIASSGDANALELIHDIIIASTSIGGAFPPVIIDVEANGISYDEMHVDGGTVNQVFVYPLGLDFDEVKERIGMTDNPQLYVVRNAPLKPIYQAINYSVIEILERSADSLLRTQGMGDIDLIYLEARRDGLDFNLTYIPDDFTEVSKAPFDRDYMNKLYKVGYDQALRGGEWEDAPPGYDEGSPR
jgi:predicted acylesterase/phospholipase RssA